MLEMSYVLLKDGLKNKGWHEKFKQQNNKKKRKKIYSFTLNFTLNFTLTTLAKWFGSCK